MFFGFGFTSVDFRRKSLFAVGYSIDSVVESSSSGLVCFLGQCSLSRAGGGELSSLLIPPPSSPAPPCLLSSPCHLPPPLHLHVTSTSTGPIGSQTSVLAVNVMHRLYACVSDSVRRAAHGRAFTGMCGHVGVFACACVCWRVIIARLC